MKQEKTLASIVIDKNNNIGLKVSGKINIIDIMILFNEIMKDYFTKLKSVSKEDKKPKSSLVLPK